MEEEKKEVRMRRKRSYFFITLKSRQTHFFFWGPEETEFATFFHVESVDVKIGLKDGSMLCP